MPNYRTINLTRVQGCYSKELREHSNDIKALLNDPNTTVEQMRNFVDTVVSFASIDGNAKKRFITNLHRCNTKEQVDQLCSDAILNGKYYTPISRRHWNAN